MKAAHSDIPKVTPKSRISCELYRCFTDLIAQSPYRPHLYAELEAQGWQRDGGFNLSQVLRRVTIWRHARNGVLTRKGYATAYRYCASQHLFGLLSGFLDGAVSLRTQMMRHEKWNDATVLIAEGDGSRTNCGHSVGLWLFITGDEPFFDPVDVSGTFDGTGAGFITPSGNRRAIAHEWQNPSRTGGTFGRWRLGGRDWSSKEMYVDRFSSRMLPNLNLSESCKLYSVVSHTRAY